jgi:hypothetical protein
MLSLNADKGFAPLFTGHEPVMLLLHQSAYNIFLEKKKKKKKKKSLTLLSHFLKKKKTKARVKWKKPSTSIALASTDYKTVTLLLC